jgi:cysteinyl-tRNA synthetase
MENGHDYAIEGDVYFSVDSFPEYLLLSGRKLDQNRAGERVIQESVIQQILPCGR